MNTRTFFWAFLVGLLGVAGCGPVVIRPPSGDAGAEVDGALDGGPGTCTSNAQCAVGEYCAGTGCGTPGTCAARPDACPAIYGPVCGCDGRTYGNSCEAAAGGSRVARGGACEAVDAGVDVPPTGCLSNAECGEGQYCAGDGCGTAGACVPRPQACTLEYNPVCGCDGRTHGNACGAASAGVRVAYRGACASVDAGVDAGPAGCVTARDCAGGRICVYPDSACARSGRCELPTPCFRAEPFCSCTGETYEGCVPDRPTLSRGPCPSVDAGVDAGPARCTSNDQCDRAQYCAGEGCGTLGACAVRPQGCPEIYSPVCGCDGRTYGNDCEAAGNGVRVAARGACPVVDAGTVRCTSNAQCAAEDYCAGDGCGTSGACVARPQACTREYDPVCGCDGRTYGNACSAASVGVRVASRGVCAAVDAGVRTCVRSSECGTRETCVYPDTACARAGTCQPTIMCFRAEPFCACTGETFWGCVPDRPTRARGECPSAPDAGVSRCAAVLCGPGTTCCEATGACYDTRCLGCCPTTPPPPPVDAGVPGCGSNSDCGTREYCAASACGARGTCTVRPQACITLYDPVCGCDGRTYGNACAAASAGMNVSYRGACR